YSPYPYMVSEAWRPPALPLPPTLPSSPRPALYTASAMSRRLLLVCLCAVLVPALAQAPAPQYAPALWSGMHYRLIGPFRGGRVTAVTGVPSEPNTFYFGSTGGGVWKTTDAGATWQNVSDGYFSTGTGSAKIRSNVSIGRGIYRSGDAGKSWNFLGLRDVGQIAAIKIDPANANV